MADQLQDVLLHRPPAAPQVDLPHEAPNRPLGQDYLGDAVDILLGGVGINNPLDPKSSSATAIGGMAGMLPLGKLFGMLRGMRGARIAKTIGQVPEELQGLRPSGHEFNQVEHPTLDPDEALKELELTAQKPPARNRGSYDPPHDGSLPKHKEVVPPFREKSGIALDVLRDMSDTVPPPAGVNITLDQWRKFRTNPSQAILDDPIFSTLARHQHDHYDKLWSQRQNGSMLSKFVSKNDNQLPNNIYSHTTGDEPRSLLFLEDDPAKFIGHLRSLDNVDALHTGKYAPTREPGMIDMMIQDLANHFTQPQYDPALQGVKVRERK